MAKKKKFIQKAISKPGTLTAMAKKANQTIDAFCGRSDLSVAAKRKCNFYMNVLKPAAAKRKK